MLTLKAFEKETGIRFTADHSGKMSGMISLSTSPLVNPVCQKRAQDPGSVCSHCYSVTYNKLRRGLREKLEANTERLKTVIPVDRMPLINAQAVRFEAFGDLYCTAQVINYFHLCERNPGVTFALWTKNPGFVDMAIKAGNAKPGNLVIILSSPELNKAYDPERIRRVFPFVDKIFTVYQKRFAQENGIEINCGARNCFECRRCYRKTDGVEMVSEQLK